MSRPTETTSAARTELGDRLEVAVSEVRMAHGWERIEGRAFAAPKRVRRSTGFVIAGSVMGGLAAAAALCAFVLTSLFGSPHELRTVDGDPATLIEASDPLGTTVHFEDGSQIHVAAGSQLEPLENSGERFVVLLRRGQARFEVEPGGPRRWVVEAGQVTVEVVGTIFTVCRDENGVTVAVERGRVLVRSERLADRVVALRQGETVHLDALEEPLAASVDPTSSDDAAGAGSDAEVPPSDAEARLPVVPTLPAESTPARAPASVPQTESLGRTPPGAPSPGTASEDETPDLATPDPSGDGLTASRLLSLADDARRSGDVSRAVELLRVASSRVDDPDAAVAGLTRARLMSRRGHPAEAVVDLRRALRLGLPSALEESARYQLVAALARSSDPVGARAAAAAYLRIYPDGAFRAEVQRDTP